MTAPEASSLDVRRTTADDVSAIVELASRSLGWAGDERDRAFFRWKHFENPFGESPAWAAFDGDRMVAFRTMMRWEFVRGDERLKMVRAVDTATDPDYQGRGLFKRLTLQAVDELSAEGVDAVFNTPNDQSRPGYLKMGWEVVGRPTLWVQPSGPVSLGRMLRARVPSEKWSEPLTVGESPTDLTGTDNYSDGWSTPASAEYLRWRFGFEPLQYRVVEVRGGAAVVRVRRRGPLREVVFAAWLSPSPDARGVRRIVRELGDYGIALGTSPRMGFVPLPRQGPIVTWRSLANAGGVPLSDLDLTLGDIELF